MPGTHLCGPPLEAALSEAGESPAQTDMPDTAEAYVFVGENNVILVRTWTYGENSGWTVEKVFSRTDNSEFGQNLDEAPFVFLAFDVEWVARMLADGKLQKVGPFPIAVPESRLRDTPPERPRRER
jgi:hypothetical protein